MVIDFGSNTMTWDEMTVPMRVLQRDRPEQTPIAEVLFLDAIDDLLQDPDEEVYTQEIGNASMSSASELGYKSKTILSSSYDKVDVSEIVSSCTHLSQSQQNDLKELLQQFDTLFDGKLKKYNGKPVHLDVDPNATPHRSKVYSVPQTHHKVFKEELERLVEIGVLEPAGRALWIAGTFIIPKKDGKVRWITDFRGLNRALTRKVYPLPRIKDILLKRPGYAFLTKLDISMQYYTFELDDESKDLCTIVTPFGLYRYCRLPMGVSQSPDIAQEMMETTLRDLMDDLAVYIDDIACFSNDWKTHMSLLHKVLSRLQDAGFTINPAKCEWAVKETDFLGHYLTPHGVRPWRKKVESMLAMQPPENLKQLRSFIGLVNYYRDMWPRRAGTLAPLTDLTGRKFVWLPEHQKAFESMKALVAGDALLAFPDHNLPFVIETDASDVQLGAVIKQNDRPVAYTTIEKELLSIVETFREFRNILLGAKITVYTDHMNLTHKLSEYSTQRVMRWRLLLEEFAPKFAYKAGPQNLVADALSRVPTSRTERENHRPDPYIVPVSAFQSFTTGAKRKRVQFEDSQASMVNCAAVKTDALRGQFADSQVILVDCDAVGTDASSGNECKVAERDQFVDSQAIMVDCDAVRTDASCGKKFQIENCLNSHFSLIYEQDVQEHQSMLFADSHLSDCFLEYPRFDQQGRHPFHFATIRQYQQQDPQVRQLPQSDPTHYRLRRYGEHELVCKYDANGNEQFCLPDNMVQPVVRWYHAVTVHAEGMDRLESSIRRHFHHPRLRETIREVVRSCHICQTMKRDGNRQHGDLAPREAESVPWKEIHVDTIGTWNIRVNGQKVSYNALTVIDPVTNLLEVRLIPNKTAAAAKRALELCWLCRYPRPLTCVHDNGSEFTGHDFQLFLEDAGIKSQPVTSLNPQSNGIIERIHATVGLIFRTMVSLHPPTTRQEADNLIQDSVAQAIFAARSVSHGALNNFSPGAVAFHRDMLLNLPFVADILSLQNLRQGYIDARLAKANQKRRPRDWAVGERVLVANAIGPGHQLRPTYSGPFSILRVHTNGNVTVQLPRGIRDRVNIRRIKPYVQP